MKVELKVLSNIYSKPDKQGKQKLIKKDVIARLTLNDQSSITYYEEAFSSKGRLLKDRCYIKVGDEVFRVKHSYEEIDKMLGNNKKDIGFNGR